MNQGRRSLLDGAAIVQSLSRWKLIPFFLAALGAVLAAIASLTMHPTAQATLLISTSATDATTLDRQTKSAIAELEASDAFSVAAGQLGTDAGDLKRRAKINPAADSGAITLEVEGENRQQAADAANAVARQMVAASETSLTEKLKALVNSTTDLMRQSPLPDAGAERARLNALAEGLAQNQSDLISATGQLRIIQEADPSMAHGPSSFTMVLLGLLGGALAGTVIAIAMGPYRGPVRSRAELVRLYPGAEVVSERHLADVVTSYRDLRTIAVAGAMSDAADVQALLTGSGVSAFLVRDARPGDISGGLAVTRIPRTVVALNRTRDESMLIVVPVIPSRTPLSELQRLSRAFDQRSVLMVADEEDRPRSDARQSRAAVG